MEIKELETQTEREMAAVILEQVIEIRKLRLALKAHEDARKVQSGGGSGMDAQKILPAGRGGSAYPKIDPMAVDVRSVV